MKYSDERSEVRILEADGFFQRFDFSLQERSQLAARQRRQGDGAHAYPDQFLDEITQSPEHTAHFAVFSFVNFDFNPGVFP